MRLGTWIAFLAAVFIIAAPLGGAEKPITIGIIPDGLTQEERLPLQRYLSKAMGRPVNLVAPDHYTETVDRLADGSFDFACLGALMYVRSHAKYGVVPLVQRASDLEFHSVFITRTGSEIYTLSDLKGKQFAFGDTNSASGHLIPYRELLQTGIHPEKDLMLRYSGSHPVTAALVETGVVDAGALDESVFNSMVATGKIDARKVRVFYTSKPFVDYVYVANKSVPAGEREKLIRALMALKPGHDDSVLKILRAKKFIAANDQEYENMRQIAKQLKMF
jgi:phosphonate transport system substrate-binding protein